MEPFVRDKAEGTKKVIVAANSSSNHSLRARSSKSLSSPRHNKNRATKTYNGYHNANGSLINLSSWPSLPGQLSPGNASPEKIPLGHYTSGNNFDNLHPGMQLANSSKFLSDSSVAKFNATLFSSVSHHASQGLDVEEAMDIDHQEANDEADSIGRDATSVLQEGISVSSQPRASKEKQHVEKYPNIGNSDCASAGAKPKV